MRKQPHSPRLFHGSCNDTEIMCLAGDEICDGRVGGNRERGLWKIKYIRYRALCSPFDRVFGNIGIDQAWRGTYQPPDKEWRALMLAARIESTNAAQSWQFQPEQSCLF